MNTFGLNGDDQDRIITAQFAQEEEALADKRFKAWLKQHPKQAGSNNK